MAKSRLPPSSASGRKGGQQFRAVGPSKSGAGSKVCGGGAVDRSDSRRVDPDVLIEKVAATFKTWVQEGTVKRFGTSKAGVYSESPL